jgi:hypothetical protein
VAEEATNMEKPLKKIRGMLVAGATNGHAFPKEIREKHGFHKRERFPAAFLLVEKQLLVHDQESPEGRAETQILWVRFENLEPSPGAPEKILSQFPVGEDFDPRKDPRVRWDPRWKEWVAYMTHSERTEAEKAPSKMVSLGDALKEAKKKPTKKTATKKKE